MKPKRNLASMTLELLAVLLLTAFMFVWGRRTAWTERGYEAVGGEYLLLLLPAIYYIGKWTVLDWIAQIRNQRRERNGSEQVLKG